MKALVTGGGGFLGKAIVRLLLAKSYSVRSFSRNKHPELTKMGVEHFRGKLSDLQSVSTAVKGCDLIFHVAAKAGVWGSFDDYFQSNVVGTENIIQACRQQGVQKLVYTSSPSVVFDGTDMEGVDESVPYPKHFHAYYPETKARAEQLVLAANDRNLATVALRPHLIWGPEDNHLVPRILERGAKGALRKIGQRDCLVDTIYIDNAAEAHIQAAEALEVDSVVAGNAYFLSNGEPLPLWDVVNRILAARNIAPVTKSISPRLAYAVGAVLERIYRLFNLSGEPRMTRFVARELSTAHWFDLSNARNDFGYLPKISIDEGMRRLQVWLERS